MDMGSFWPRDKFWIIAVIDTLPQALPFIQGLPAEAFKIGLELFQLYPVCFFTEGRAIIEADLTFPEGSSIPIFKTMIGRI
jgi:hypothetical protein